MKYLAAVFAILLLVIVIAADRGTLPPALHKIYDIPYGDKAGHFILLGLLSLLVNAAVLAGPATRSLRHLALATTAIMLVVTAEEFSQLFFKTRTFDLLDLASSFAGILASAWLAWRTKPAEAR